MYDIDWEEYFTFLCPFQQPEEIVGQPPLHLPMIPIDTLQF